MNIIEKLQKAKDWISIDANYYKVLLIAFALLALAMNFIYVEEKNSFLALCSNYCRDTVNGTPISHQGLDCQCLHYESITRDDNIGMGNFHPKLSNAGLS
jgi:hypothetical protein